MPTKRWDLYYLNMARQAATASRCVKRQVGAVIVNNNRIVSTGFNGRPRGTDCDDSECLRKDIPTGKDQQIICCLHGELNACLFAGTKEAEGGTIYITHAPCLLCAPMLLQMKFSRIIFLRDDRKQDGIEYMRKMTKKIKIFEYDPDTDTFKDVT